MSHLDREKTFGIGLISLCVALCVALRFALCFALCFGFTICFSLPAAAQGNGSVQRESAADATAGLLDLLDEPQPNANVNANANANAPESTSLTPAEVGLDGEELGEQTDNPLASVRQSMLIAAGFLRKGQAGSETQRLQTDIVTRLDEIIAQIENAQEQAQPDAGQSEPSSSQQQEQSLQESQSQASEGTGQQREQKQENTETSESPTAEPMGDGPGSKGPNATPKVQLADPRALQQSAWGQLPERVRSQMQSRMVDRFLPSYRSQIEAYFRALMDLNRQTDSP